MLREKQNVLLTGTFKTLGTINYNWLVKVEKVLFYERELIKPQPKHWRLFAKTLNLKAIVLNPILVVTIFQILTVDPLNFKTNLLKLD